MYVLFLFATSSFFAQVKTSIDRDSIQIGEEIQYTIAIEVDSTTTVQFPEGQTFVPFEVLEEYPIDSTPTKWTKKYALTQFDSGRYVIPRQVVHLNDKTLKTDSLLVEVADVAVDTTSQKMYDIKPITPVGSVTPKWVEHTLWFLLILVLVGSAAFLILRRKRKLQEAKEQLPPYEEALVALQTLDSKPYLKESRVKDYYSSLTEIVKRYLDREVDEEALESTTDELIAKLQLHKDAGHLEFDKKTIEKLNEILKRADLIKFAKMQMEPGQASLDRKEIEGIINETHSAIPEPTEEELLQDEIYRQEQLRKKKHKRIRNTITAVAATIVLSLAVFSVIFGVDTVKDTLTGNTTKNLAEGQWIRSEYGNPAVILETPEVLVRKDTTTKDPGNPFFTLDDVFTYGDVRKKLFVMVEASKGGVTEENQLADILEKKLQILEENGATNLIVKDEPFETEKGIKGIRASGEFNVRIGKNKYKKEKSEYELLLFAQDGGIQEVLLVIEKNDTHAQEIKERILNSVELEIFKP